MRARNLKPSIFKNEILGAADALYTILFEGLWCLADREGRLEDRPLRIKAEVFPYRDGIALDTMLDWLAQYEFILRYVADGQRIIQIVTFLEHQHPHKNEIQSVLPAPQVIDFNDGGKEHDQGTKSLQPRQEVDTAKDGSTPPSYLLPLTDSLLLTPALAPQAQSPPAETSETPKRQTSATSKRKTPKSPEFPLPEDFGIDPELERYAQDHLPAVDPKALMEKFRLQARTKQWQYADWRLAFMTYIRNCVPNSGHWAAGQYPRRGKGGIQWA